MSFLNIKEVQDLKGVPQSPEVHPEGDAYEHTKLVVEYLQDKLGVYSRDDYDWQKPEDELLILAAALHDIGKASTTKLSKAGRISAFGHEKVGAKMVPAICERMGLLPYATEKVQWLVRHHMYPHREGQISAKKWKRVAEHEWFQDLLLLAQADEEARK